MMKYIRWMRMNWWWKKKKLSRFSLAGREKKERKWWWQFVIQFMKVERKKEWRGFWWKNSHFFPNEKKEGSKEKILIRWVNEQIKFERRQRKAGRKGALGCWRWREDFTCFSFSWPWRHPNNKWNIREETGKKQVLDLVASTFKVKGKINSCVEEEAGERWTKGRSSRKMAEKKEKKKRKHVGTLFTAKESKKERKKKRIERTETWVEV